MDLNHRITVNTFRFPFVPLPESLCCHRDNQELVAGRWGYEPQIFVSKTFFTENTISFLIEENIEIVFLCYYLPIFYFKERLKKLEEIRWFCFCMFLICREIYCKNHQFFYL